MATNRKKPTPLLTFRAYPKEGGSLYFQVVVWRTVKELRAAGRRMDLNRKGLVECAAFVSPYRVTRVTPSGWRKKRTLGEIHFAKNQCGIEVLAHESTHAALYWAEQKKLLHGVRNASDGAASEEEEAFCYAVGVLAEQIGQRIHKAGLYK